MHLMSSRLTAQQARLGYSSQRSPAALAAAVALNAGIVTLLVALPATQYLKTPPLPRTETRFIELDPVPPPSPEPKAEPQTRSDHPVRQDPVIEPLKVAQVIDLGGGPTLTMRDDPPIVMGGGAVDPPITPRLIELVKAQPDPRYADSFRPPYPPSMQREGLEGAVTLRVMIDARGRVSAVEEVSATHPAFFEAARRHALRAWRFRPATRDGIAVPSEQIMTLRFQLER
jgi:protein TonB